LPQGTESGTDINNRPFPLSIPRTQTNRALSENSLSTFKLHRFERRAEFLSGEIVRHGDPVIVLEHPWEGVLTYVYGSVIKTTIYRMWYQARGVYIAYARSRDGIHWEKPLFKAFTVDEPSVGPTVDLAGAAVNCARA
jgi:hypothetical protein